MYGLEAMHLTNAQTNRMLYAYNSVFYKLFCSFNPNIILHSQFYSSHLNLRSLIDFRTVTFLTDLPFYDGSCPASHLFYICGTSEWFELTNKYNIDYSDSIQQCKAKIWAAFGMAISALA